MQNKMKSSEELRPLLAILRSIEKKIVFTNGCFDILHTGHTRYLSKAKSLGQVLVVAINSDASVRTIKGEKRPINLLTERMETIAALESVDFVTFFNEPDPYNIISMLEPDILVKGGDWPVEQIIGGDIVLARGGEVVNVPYIEGASTTGIIERILRKYK
jgi:rfaE bifunctional protein nucleotidyltransferase chain/domain